MSDYSSLKATINANIKANNNQEITGEILNSVLNAMVDSLGAGYQYKGVATPTNPGTAQTPDYKCFYIAATPGTYTYLGGLVVADGEVAILKYDSSWTKEVTGIASADKLNQLKQDLIVAEQGGVKPGYVLETNGGYVRGYFPFISGEVYEILLSNDSVVNTLQVIFFDANSKDVKTISIQRGSVYIFIAEADYAGYRYGASGFVSVSATSKYAINDKIANEVAVGISSKVDIGFENILDKSQIVNGSAYNSTGALLQNAGWNNLFGSILLPWRNQQYITANYVGGQGGTYVVQFDRNSNFIPGSEITNVTGVQTFQKYSKEAYYLGLTLIDANRALLSRPLRANYGQTLTEDRLSPNPIKKYLDDVNGKAVELYAYGDDADSATLDDATHFYGWKNGKCAWQRAIDAADGFTKTIIYCKGVVYVNNANQFTIQEDGFHNVVFIPSTKSNIQLVGESPDRTALVVEMPDDFANIETYQPMGIYGNNSLVKNVAVSGKNCRYCVHVDASARNIGIADNYYIKFQDCVFRHYPNVGNSFSLAYACCASDGMTIEAERCRFIQHTSFTTPLYTHDGKNYNKGGILVFKECVLEATDGVQMMLIQTLGSNADSDIVIDGLDYGISYPIILCEPNNASSKTNLNDYDAKPIMRIRGTLDKPISYETRNSNSRVLRITSKTIGAGSSVRFNASSSAFDLLIRGHYKTDYTENTGIVHVNGYHYRDGVDILKGYAMGELALDVNRICSMQNRLGDCSVNSKELIVVVDGTNYTITFNQDYRNYTDEQMLEVFTDVLGAVADVELYNWAEDYFPELLPSMMHRKNTSNETILVGMGVRFRGNKMQKASNDDEVHGIAIDDIPPGCYGRVVKKAMLSIYEDSRHHICLETYPIRNTSDFYSYRGYFGIGSTPGVFVSKTQKAPLYGWDKGGFDHYLTINLD